MFNFLKKTDTTSPTLIELQEFYRILDLFNTTQQKVVDCLVELWGMPTPINRNQWIVWSQNQYVLDNFKNNHEITIFPHGFGLSYQDSEIFIDFDFGKNGEIYGFDVNRIWYFIQQNKIKTLFRSEKQIQKVVDHQTKLQKLIFSGYINYYKNESVE